MRGTIMQALRASDALIALVSLLLLNREVEGSKP